MNAKIVVGLDGSEGSLRALRWASAIAIEVGASVQPAMAWEYPALAMLPYPAGLPVPPEGSMQGDAQERLLGLVASAGLPDELEVAEPVAVHGSPGRVLCEVAASADLLVIGSRGLGFVKGVLLGSVSAHCANTAPCPVVVVPPDEAPTGQTAERVIVGVDGSSLSDEAVLWADRWAPAEALLVLVHVWDVPLTVDSAALNLDSAVFETAAKAMLDQAASLVTGHKVELRKIRGDARVELERLATEADLLVVGARGRSAFERFLMGSVASHSVHHLQTPSVIVRSAEDPS